MNKEELYKQIENFNTTLTDPSDRSSRTYQEARLFVNNDEAHGKASFIEYLVENGYLQNSYNTILDMTFGSGNLTSHIVFGNEIIYETLYLNDKNRNKTNQNIKNYIDNCTILNYDILEDGISNKIDADLVILNPQLGGNYTEGDLYQQRQEKEKNQDILDKLASNINVYLEGGATVLFYGDDKDFKALFGECNYIRYKSEFKQLYIVNNDLEDVKCFQKTDYSFEEVDCDNENLDREDEVKDFDNLDLLLSSCDDSKENDNENKEIEKIKVIILIIFYFIWILLAQFFAFLSFSDIIFYLFYVFLQFSIIFIFISNSNFLYFIYNIFSYVIGYPKVFRFYSYFIIFQFFFTINNYFINI